MIEMINTQEHDLHLSLDEFDAFYKKARNRFYKFLGLSSTSKTATLADNTEDMEFTNIKTVFASTQYSGRTSIDDNFIYDFSHPKRGLAVIINNENFEDVESFGSRKGSDKDADSLVQTFKTLGFDVCIENDLTADQMACWLTLVAKEYDHAAADCFVCVVLTHGSESNIYSDRRKTERRDLLYGVDGNAIPTQLLVDTFNDIKCPQLTGKPRLFFFQACRGSKTDAGTCINVIVKNQATCDVPSTLRHRPTTKSLIPSPTTSDTPLINLQDSKENISGNACGTSPKFDAIEDRDEIHSLLLNLNLFEDKDATDAKPESLKENVCEMDTVTIDPVFLYKDCVVMYATPPGYLSWRNEAFGSWFIQSLCKVLDSNPVKAGQWTLLKALTYVSACVTQNYHSRSQDDQEYNMKKEQPVIYSMLVKDVVMKCKQRNVT